MRYIFTILLCFLWLFAVQAQSPTRIKLTQLEQAKTVEGSKAGQIPLSNSAGDLRYAQYVEIDLNQIAFVPTATGNTSNYSEFVTASDSSKWYIDWQGRGFPLTGGSSTDKNGYYGGNFGNGGDNTIPSVTKSTLTNQLTFYRATDDLGGFSPIRVEVGAGNEPDFITCKYSSTDSCTWGRSDFEWQMHSTTGLNLWADNIVSLRGDSISMQDVGTAWGTGKRSFLVHMSNFMVKKQVGINEIDLNFDPYQTISATGAGPASYNIELSDGGGFVTLTEGANIDLTRSGDVITIAATTGGAGQTLSVASNTTTLSGGGGSMTIAGAGINVATTSGTTITITGTEVDGLTTNEGSLTVGAGTGTTSIINSNTSGSTGVTITAGTGLSISEVGNVITLTNTSPDVPQTLSVASNTTTLSGGGGSMTIAGAGINVATTSGTTITITGTEVDGLTTNEGSLTVGAGTGTTSIINSNTSGSTGVTITAGTGLSISEAGNVITLTSTVSDTKNGYYGGNAGNGGDNTIPSVTKSTLTNQLTFYRATDDFGGFSPIRVEVGAGNEPDFITCKYSSTDSCTWGRSDFEYIMHSSNGMVLQGDTYVAMNGDSVSLQQIGTPYGTGKRNFLVQMNNFYVKKQLGINSVDLNFTAAEAQTITDYTTAGSFTYTVPAGAKSVAIITLGAGGGGGSGRKGAVASARFGGGGGSAGAVSEGNYSILELGSPGTLTVNVGAAGTGGAAVSANSTNGNSGTNGGDSWVEVSGTKFIYAAGGFFGAGGTNAAGTGGPLQDTGDQGGKAGGNGAGSAPAVSVSSSKNKCGGSGGGGGGISSGNATQAPAVGGAGYYSLISGGTAGVNGTPNGGNGTAHSLDQLTGGGGGGGFCGVATTNGGTGGAGDRGCGGGGGGAGIDGSNNSGAGGPGGAGFVRIIANF